MRPVSAEFLRTISGSHTMTARATILDTFQTGTQPTGTEIPILAGTTVHDGTAAIRGSLDLTTDGTGLWPRRANDLLAPYGNEVFVERGIAYGNGTTEWVSLGYFRIDSPAQSTPPNGPIRLTGKDRMAGVIDGRLLAPVQYQPTDTYGTIMTALITQVYPGATIQWDDATDTQPTGRQLLSESDRFAFLDDLVTSVGKIWFWDHRGILVIRAAPPPTAPVYTVQSGEGGVLVSMSRQLTRNGVYNAVVAAGEAADTQTPVTAVAIDNNPDSPTYFYGRFGPVPLFYSSPFLTATTQAAAAAEALLRRRLGLPYAVDFATVPNPALEPYDPVTVRASTADASEIHVIESVTLPLAAAGTQTATTREQTLVLIGAL